MKSFGVGRFATTQAQVLKSKLNLNRRFKFLSQLPPEFKNSVTERDLPDQEALVIRLKKPEKDDVLDLLTHLEEDRPWMKRARRSAVSLRWRA